MIMDYQMSVPLCIDLDGTLIKTDSLFESFIILIKKNPLYLFLAFLWFLKGIASLKYEIASRAELNPATLPYSKDLLVYLKKEYDSGRKLILVTAADKRIAEAIADYLGIFSQVLASDGRNNLKGQNKSNLLNKLSGSKNYDYVGNDAHDLHVWASARNAIVVNANSRLIRRVQKIATVERIFPSEKNKIFAILKA